MLPDSIEPLNSKETCMVEVWKNRKKEPPQDSARIISDSFCDVFYEETEQQLQGAEDLSGQHSSKPDDERSWIREKHTRLGYRRMR